VSGNGGARQIFFLSRGAPDAGVLTIHGWYSVKTRLVEAVLWTDDRSAGEAFRTRCWARRETPRLGTMGALQRCGLAGPAPDVIRLERPERDPWDLSDRRR